jgi:hypothetical protein
MRALVGDQGAALAALYELLDASMGTLLIWIDYASLIFITEEPTAP